ncbi:hypothetical protein E2C01_052545 [Portunus trituberculatus]|uniref:Uncharacterized protein n=1 Tax=Portunus trituberculatus TaxID=210409 RepID=A0A5B7GLT5_PORTR|nr:hypothetical protein [Portunus trituberculatus]
MAQKRGRERDEDPLNTLRRRGCPTRRSSSRHNGDASTVGVVVVAGGPHVSKATTTHRLSPPPQPTASPQPTQP